MSGRSLSADKEVAGTTYSSGSDDAEASQLPDRQRRQVPIVDSHNLGQKSNEKTIPDQDRGFKAQEVGRR
jgi:hypothetical protein